MTFLRQRETSRISSRGKGPVYNTKSGGGRLSPFQCVIRTCEHRDTGIVGLATASVDVNDSSLEEVTFASSQCHRCTTCRNFPRSSCKAQAECMIIEHRPPLSIRPRQSCDLYQDNVQRFLNHVALLKHRTAKFSSNRHRKLQPFRET